MLDANLLTPSELRKLADEKEKIQHKMAGYLKHDLYILDSKYYDLRTKNDAYWWLITQQELESILICLKAELTSNKIKKGSKFASYIEDNNILWYHEKECIIDMMNEDWAQENLENICEI